MSRSRTDLRGQVVLVTGASAGIGRAAALKFDRLGARVAMAARRADRLAENATHMTDPLVVPTDVSDLGQVDSMVDRTIEHFGRLDVLVNNAGVTRVERSDSMDIEAVVRMFEVNFLSAMVATRRAVPQMRQQGRGQIVNVTSPAGVLGVPFAPAYAATKAAMTGWTRTLQGEWAGTEILVTEYNPGLVATEMGQAATTDPRIRLDEAALANRQWSILKRLTVRQLSSEEVGAHIVDCVRRRRQIAYSTPRQTLTLHLSEIPFVRRALGADSARTMRQRLGIETWTEMEPPRQGMGPGSS